jgi:hypothetical protein
MWRIFAIGIAFVSWLGVTAQVANNTIHNRFQLTPDGETLNSNTAQSTVEWNCINKSLTKACLVYHNDQWFYFKTAIAGKYFLNISAQQCRNQQGVQLVVIEGNPCEVDTYRVLKCIPKIFQDDVFLELDSVKANTLYLVNIDGFLGDYCEFDIRLTTKPSGIPLLQTSMDTLNVQAALNKNLVTLQWHSTHGQLEQLAFFEIYRVKTGEHKSAFKGIVALQNNALGKYVEDYRFTDTLSVQGEYQYKIIGVARELENRWVLDRIKLRFDPQIRTKQFIGRLPLSFTSNGAVGITIINAHTDQALTFFSHPYSLPEVVDVNLTRFVNAGVTRFWIRARNTKTKEVRQYTYRLTAEGELVLVEK